ncbi:MAG: TrkA C-terminal domain-containing protein [Roseicyclus sp.]
MALASLLIVIALSFLVVRIGTIALVMTGLSEEVARFQSLSAFSGAGFTTSEAESVTDEVARRRIAAMLIRAGSVGAVSAIATTILTFLGSEADTLLQVVLLVAGAALILLLARSERLNRWATPVIRRALRNLAASELRDYAALLHLREDWHVSLVDVEDGGWLAQRTLAELDLQAEGVTILGIERHGGDFRGAPSGGTRLVTGDRLIVYGKAGRLQELRRRRERDDRAHTEAASEHRAEQAADVQKDPDAAPAEEAPKAEGPA